MSGCQNLHDVHISGVTLSGIIGYGLSQLRSRITHSVSGTLDGAIGTRTVHSDEGEHQSLRSYFIKSWGLNSETCNDDATFKMRIAHQHTLTMNESLLVGRGVLLLLVTMTSSEEGTLDINYSVHVKASAGAVTRSIPLIVENLGESVAAVRRLNDAKMLCPNGRTSTPSAQVDVASERAAVVSSSIAACVSHQESVYQEEMNGAVAEYDAAWSEYVKAWTEYQQLLASSRNAS